MKDRRSELATELAFLTNIEAINGIVLVLLILLALLGKEVQIIDIFDEECNKVDFQTNCSSFSLVKFSY